MKNAHKKELLTNLIAKYNWHIDFLELDIIATSTLSSQKTQDSLLHLLARKNDIQGIDIVIAHGVPIDIIGDLGMTPLHNAAMRGQLEAVKHLLNLGANPKIKDEFGQTAIRVAELGGYREIVDFLKTN